MKGSPPAVNLCCGTPQSAFRKPFCSLCDGLQSVQGADAFQHCALVVVESYVCAGLSHLLRGSKFADRRLRSRAEAVDNCVVFPREKCGSFAHDDLPEQYGGLLALIVGERGNQIMFVAVETHCQTVIAE